jgi:hypothetical protein
MYSKRGLDSHRIQKGGWPMKTKSRRTKVAKMMWGMSLWKWKATGGDIKSSTEKKMRRELE